MLAERLEHLEREIQKMKLECANEYREHIIWKENLSREYQMHLSRLQDLITDRDIVQYMIDQEWSMK